MGNFKYTEAIAEVERILERLGRQPCDVDTLAAETARATELLAQCRTHLLAAKEDVNDVLDKESPVRV